MKKFFAYALALVAIATAPGAAKQAVAADDAVKPVAIVSIASYDRLMTDIGFIGDLMGSPGLDKNLEGMIQLFTQGQGLVGLDRTKPLGLTLATDGAQFQPLILLPVTSLKQLLETLEGILGPAQDAGNGVFELDVFGQKLYVKERSNYGVMSTSPEALNELPKDPASLLGGLDKTYDIAGRLYIQNVPEVFRGLIIDQLKVGVETGLARQEGESDASYENRRKMVDSQIEMLTKVINDVDQLTLGVVLNPTAKTAALDIGITAVSGTGIAKALAQLQGGTSDFLGFLAPEAAASLNVSARVDQESSEALITALRTIRGQIVNSIDTSTQLPDEGTKKLAKDLLAQVWDAIEATMRTGRLDGGATLLLTDKSLTLAAGAHVADPKSLEDALKKIAQNSGNDPKFPQIKFNAEQHAGVNFHTTMINVPQDLPVAKVLGDKLDVAVGIGPKSAYLALGPGSLKLVKELIDKSKSQSSQIVPPMQLNVALADIFKFAAAVQDTPETKATADLLAKSNGKDHVKVVVTPLPNAINIRIEAQEGVLQLLGNALKDAQAAGGGALPIPGLGP